MMDLRFLSAVAMLGLSACVKPAGPVAVDPASGVTLLTSLPVPTGDDVRSSVRTSFVGPFSELSLDVFGVRDLRLDVVTDGEGRFTFPLIGAVEGAGKTPEQLATEIETRLRGRYLRDPRVTVNFRTPQNPLTFQAQGVTIDGEVRKPGQYPLSGKATLMRAVALAGGTTEFSKLDDVLVFRNVAGQQYVGVYNLLAIRRGNYADPEVFPNDVVVVGDSPQRRMLDNILKASTLLSTPLVILGNQL
ncbi:polysaccharide biosynthesis/export family protein [Sphingopyxis granuli]|uniref:Polysaccharide export protein n=1 Tax=Sphingopyxis granuli TaxID=267128 RepID=A0AA86GKV0_9SPHN|nr:polysaccharide biosynthesis/export family protein [Sphingopyxis granuli]AMG74742.1 Polysaccharide export protein [Sphingopyxis granuli]